MKETTEENRIDADLSRREFIAACSQVAVAGTVVFVTAESPGLACTNGISAPLADIGIVEDAADYERMEDSFIRYGLMQISVNQLIDYKPCAGHLLRSAPQHVSISLVKTLRSEGIRTASQISDSLDVPGLTAYEREVLSMWLAMEKDRLRQEFALNYRLAKDPAYVPFAGWWNGLDAQTLCSV